MRNDRKTSTAFIFLGCLLTAVFAVGLISSRNPEAFLSRYRYDYALESFLRFCRAVWLPAGIAGIPMFLISLLLSLWRENRGRNRRQ